MKPVTRSKVWKVTAAVSVLALVGACADSSDGGGDANGMIPPPSPDPDPAPVVYVPLEALDADAASPLTRIGSEGEGIEVDVVGLLNHETGEIETDEADSESVRFNADRTEITVTPVQGGSPVVIDVSDPAGTDYVRVYEVLDAGGMLQERGVVGRATDLSDIPGAQRGTVAYSGRSTVYAVVGNTTYDLNGEASVVANFTDRQADVTLSDFGGRVFDSSGQSIIGLPDAEVRLRGGRIEDGGFSGDEATIDVVNMPFTLSDQADRDAEARFFGPDAREVGGGVQIKDPTGTGNELFGTFIGKQD